MKRHILPAFAVLPALLAALLLSVPAAAQEEDKPVFSDLVEVTEVFLDVLATDKEGNTILGLGKDDFVVVEEGKKVQVTSVSYYTTRYAGDDDDLMAPLAEASGGDVAQELPASRYFILFFEDQLRNNDASNRLLRQQLDAGRRAHDWVTGGLQGSDWVAVVSYDVKLEVHADFTQDTAELIDAIHAATTNKKEELPTRREYREAARRPLSLLKGLPEGIELRDETKTIYDAVRLLAEATRPIVGRKNLLLFTIGFGELRSGGYSEGDPRYYPEMEEALNDNNVAVYPIDMFPPGTVHTQAHFLNELALDSGGRYFYNFVSFKTPLEQIAAENTGYYLLSYRTEHPAGESGYREVKVKAKDKKIRVRARRGYRFGI